MWFCNLDSQYSLLLEILEIMCCWISSIPSSELEDNFCFLDVTRSYYASLVRTVFLRLCYSTMHCIDQMQVSLKNYSQSLYIIDLVKCKQILKIQPHLFQKKFTTKTQIWPPANSLFWFLEVHDDVLTSRGSHVWVAVSTIFPQTAFNIQHQLFHWLH